MTAPENAEKPNMLVLFSAALCLNALLLFWVQPMFGKMALPLLGGSPSVWTTCMLFFQAALLAGYAYAHAGIRLLGVKRHALLHAVVVWLPLLVLPIGLQGAGTPPTDREPIGWLLVAMASNVGLPFVVLATSAPLLQRWFGSTGHTRANDPYFLYAASNAGSLVALVAFPTVLEPLIPLRQQQTIWQVSYAVVAGFLTVCALIAYRRAAIADSASTAVVSRPDEVRQSPTTVDRLRWLGLSFAPSSLMLAVTTYLSTDVAAVPLLWVVPLAIYLLTFIVAFGGHAQSTLSIAARVLPLIILPLAITMIGGVYLPLWFSIPFHLLAFAILALLCHGELARSRPHATQLTEFYLWLATGGLLGGVFNTLVAPQVFSSVAEYPLAIASGCVLLVSSAQVREVLSRPRLLARPALATALATMMVIAGRLVGLAALPTTALLGAPLFVCFSVRRDQARFALGIVGLFAAFAIGAFVTPVQGGSVVHAERTFFGVYRVTTTPQYGFVSLIHGTTLHGRQIQNAPIPEPLTYFHRKSPIGDVFAARGEGARSVGIVGLGIGTLAAYAQPSSHWVFYEIDPAVERIARDTQFFRFLEVCGSRCRVVLGDARLSLAHTNDQYDVLVLDAFSSDAIPVHLLTTEALRVYEQRLTAGGILAMHISNRHIKLRPVLGRLARDRGWIAFARFDAREDNTSGVTASDWVVLARNAEDAGAIARDPRWTRITSADGPAWSDDFSNVWTTLRWREW